MITNFPPDGLRPMKDFDPAQPAILHDVVSDRIMTWDWKRADDFRKNAVTDRRGRIAWEDKLFDGWGNVLGG
jgi:hypothetical protein